MRATTLTERRRWDGRSMQSALRPWSCFNRWALHSKNSKFLVRLVIHIFLRWNEHGRGAPDRLTKSSVQPRQNGGLLSRPIRWCESVRLHVMQELRVASREDLSGRVPSIIEQA